MSVYGLKMAAKYGEKLEEFKDLSDAEDYFISYKDCLLNKFEEICAQKSCFEPDYTVESLKRIEKWYFELYENKEFDKVGLTREEFERVMSVYFGEVVVRNNEDAKWVVAEYPFMKKKYELLINKQLFNMSIINHCHDLCRRQNNKRRNLLLREYNKYFVRL